MRLFMILGIFCCCASVGLIVFSNHANACQAELCPRDDDFLPDEGVEVPANLEGIFRYHLFVPPGGGEEEAAMEVRRMEGGQPADEVPAEEHESEVGNGAFEVLFEDPLQPGESYRVRGEKACAPIQPEDADDELELRFDTGDEAPIPDSLGELEIVDTQTASLQVRHAASCSHEIRAAQAEVWLTLSDEAEPWEPVLWYQTMVDGERWTARRSVGEEVPGGSSWIGRGKDLIYADCSGEDGLEEGDYTVQMLAHLPGTQEAIASDEVQITLECSTFGGRGCGCHATSSGGGTLGAFFALLVVLGIARRSASRAS